MKKILIIGNSPLPDENTESRPAAGLRTYQFLRSVLRDEENHAFLITIGMPECYGKDGLKRDIELVKHEKYSRITISKDSPDLKSLIQAELDRYQPDVVVGVNTYPSYIAAKLRFGVPFFADLNGWIMAEAQAQAFKNGNNDYLPHYQSLEHTIIRRADKISTVSENQMKALWGELATIGRLNKESFGYELACHVANGTEDLGENTESEARHAEVQRMFHQVPKDAKTALWLGGYNTWVDEETLFRGLEKAMSDCPELHFASTGGKIKGLDNSTFHNFKKLIDSSIYKDRFHFLGWVDTELIPYIYERVDLGINVDRMCIETLTGARNRINEMMKFGLPVVTTLGSEISYEVKKYETGIAVESGNSEELAAAIEKVLQDGSEYGRNGRKYIKEKCNFEYVCRPFIEWLKNPQKAPDSHLNIKLPHQNRLKAKTLMRYLRENGLKKFIRKAIQKLRS